MKTKIIYILCAISFISFGANAQEDRQGKVDVSGQWQIGIPFNDYVDNNASGWGANVESHYFIANQVAIGGFISYQTFMNYFPKETMTLDGPSYGGAVTMDRYQTIYELPFGVSARYHFMSSTGIFDPYVALKLGANYSIQRRYYNVYEGYSENWGFTVLPELGTMIFLDSNKHVGFHLAVFYNYATNQSDNDAIDVDGISSLGFRVGMNFRF